MTQPTTTILHLEDSDLDAEFVKVWLGRAAVPVAVERVSDKKAFVAKLREKPFDLILSDYQVPTFERLAALDLARELQPATPFIFVSGAMGEELAVETLKRGATDYVLKDRLSRLPAVVERALAEARERAERKAAEAAAATANARAAAILEQLTEGFVVLDRNWAFTYVNAAFERMHNVRREWLLGKSYWAVYPATVGTPLEANYRRVMATREPCEFENYYQPWDRWFAIKAAPADGDGICVQVRDVTEAKRVAAALQASEERFRTTADHAPVLIWIADPTRACVWFNRPWLRFTGRALDQEAGSGWADGVHPDDRPRRLDTYAARFDARQPFTLEYRLRRHDGAYRWVLDHGVPLYAPDGTFNGYIGSCVDIEDRKRAEEALRDADRRKDEFLATLAHELRNPLAPVRTGLQILKLAAGPGEMAAKARAMMERQITHMVRLIDDLLDVSRVSRGKIELKKEFVSLRSVLDGAVETSRPLIEAARHELVVHAPAAPLTLFADPTRIAQVVSNLLNNAAKYTPDGGRIELTAERDGGEAVVRVTDTGDGIPADMLPQVFDLFTQVGRSLDRAQGGLGIGLSLVRKLVEMHGGTVAGESAGPGRGSTFTVRLPLAQTVADLDLAEAAGRPRAPADPRRVLVVDDNVDAAQSLAMLLALGGHETAMAHTGPDALAAAARFRPEVVFLDIGLPGLNGYEVAARYRADPALPPAFLVALTGWGSEEDRQRAAAAGFDLHLTKPVESGAVAEALDRFARRVGPPGGGPI